LSNQGIESHMIEKAGSYGIKALANAFAITDKLEKLERKKARGESLSAKEKEQLKVLNQRAREENFEVFELGTGHLKGKEKAGVEKLLKEKREVKEEEKYQYIVRRYEEESRKGIFEPRESETAKFFRENPEANPFR
jgi:hypothetical protein